MTTVFQMSSKDELIHTNKTEQMRRTVKCMNES